MACFNGEYPVHYDPLVEKLQLERHRTGESLVASVGASLNGNGPVNGNGKHAELGLFSMKLEEQKGTFARQ
jgi:hypothetical protein